jgi:hypothetical protein
MYRSVKVADSPFRPELFTEPKNYEETPLCDRKSDMYGLRPGGMDDRKKAELVRDVIAMANTACVRRKPAHLLMGIDDEGAVGGLEEHLVVFEYDNKAELNVWEAVRRKFDDIIRNYIQPNVQWDLKHGKVIVNKREEVEDRLVPVAYLIIQPANLDKFYSAKRQIRNEIVSGQCWIRSGESKHELTRQEIQANDWSKYVDVPHSFPSDWKRYFEKQLSDTPLRMAQEIEYYIELRTEDGDSLQDKFEQFLDDQGSNLLIIQGNAGSGKSTFVQRMTS